MGRRRLFSAVLRAAAALLVLCPALVGAQTADGDGPPPSGVAAYEEAVGSIIAEALQNAGAYRNLEELTSTAPRRLSGSPAAAAAVEWARTTMIREGLENVRLEPVTVPHWVRGDVGKVRIVGPAGAAGEELKMLALGGSDATPEGGVTAEVIAVTSFEELARRKDEARGKIVLFNEPMDRERLDTFSAYGDAVRQRTQGAIMAARAGAVAALVRSVTTALDDVPHTGAMHYRDDTPRVAAAAVSTIGAERIASLLAQGKKVTVHFEQNCQWLADAPSHNVVGELPGSERPEEIVVVGGHLDSWDVGQGAHDDGSGVCHAIEVVRILKTLGLRPKRTIRVIAFMNEENGLAGGRTYYEDHLEEMDAHVMAVESDRGGFTPRGFTTDANPKALAILREIAGLLEESGAGIMKRGSGGADISPMKRSGVVTVGYLPDCHRYFDYHHTPEDTFDKVNERELQLGAAVIASLVYIVADLDETLPRNPNAP